MTGAWRLALRNLARNRRRNQATAVAIAFGYAGLVLLGGYATRIERFLTQVSPFFRLPANVSAPGRLGRAA